MNFKKIAFFALTISTASFASEIKALDGASFSNYVRQTLNGSNKDPFDIEKVKQSGLQTSELFVRVAIEMILESLRLQEMAKTDKGVSAEVALTASQNIFSNMIGSYALLIEKSSNTSPIESRKESNVVQEPKLAINPNPTEEEEKDQKVSTIKQSLQFLEGLDPKSNEKLGKALTEIHSRATEVATS